MLGYVLTRLMHALVVVFGVVTVIFVVVRLVPGDPAALLLGSSATAEDVSALRADLGLDQPLIVQYVTYLWDALRLDFGRSYIYSQPAVDLVVDRLPATVYLALVSVVFSVAVSVPLGIIAALRARRWPDQVISSTSLAVQAMPNFWVGIVMILVFARMLQWLPAAGDRHWNSVVLPAITLALPFIGILVRLLRGGLLEVMGQGYIQTARAKGLSERTVLYAHGVRNALIPVVTVAGLQLGALLGGGVVVETVFAWPGVGRLLVDSIANRDFSVVQAATAFIAIAFVAVNLGVDLLYGYLDPRIRLGAKS